MTLVTASLTVDSLTGIATHTLFYDGVQGSVFTFTKSTERFTAPALTSPLTMSLSNYQMAVESLQRWTDAAEGEMGALIRPPLPSHKTELKLVRDDAKPLRADLIIGVDKIVDVEWKTQDSEVKVKTRPAFDLDISGMTLWLIQHERLAQAARDYLAGK